MCQHPIAPSACGLNEHSGIRKKLRSFQKRIIMNHKLTKVSLHFSEFSIIQCTHNNICVLDNNEAGKSTTNLTAITNISYVKFNFVTLRIMYS